MKGVMFRQFSSIAASSAPRTSMAVLNVILKHIQDLSKKRDHILQLGKVIWERKIEALDIMQREVLRSESRVVHQLRLLQKLNMEIMQAGQVQISVQLDIIYKNADDLQQKLSVISQIEETINPGVSIDTPNLYLLNTKSRVVYGINLLRKVLDDIAWESELHELNNHVIPKSRGLAEIITPHHSLGSIHMRPEGSVGHFKTGAVESMNINGKVESEPLDKQRYLLIYNGCKTFCLDLKHSKYLPLRGVGDVPPLPRIATLNLPEENVPTVVGLFKWRSNAYIIGGQNLPKTLEEENPKGIKLYKALDDSKFSLSHSESIKMCNLKKPKTSPIAEKINDELLVIDCLGCHEVIDSDSGC